MSLLSSLLFLMCIAIFMTCVAGILQCYETMLEEVNRCLPEGQKIKRPYLSNKYYEVLKLHTQFYPQSRVRTANRFLFRVLVITFGSLAFVSLAWVILRGPQHP